MTHPQARRELTALKHLANGRTLVWTATALELLPKDVREIAKRHAALRKDGTIDPILAGHAALELAQQTGDTIPTREAPPPPARPPAVVARVAPPVTRVAPPVSRPAAAPAAAGDTLQDVAVGRLRPDPDNPRTDVGDVAELAASLRAVGLLQPIVARRTAGGDLVVVAGHRRLAAAKAAGWSTVPVIVRAEMRPDDVLAAMLVENSHRKDLDPIEEARGYARLKAQLGTTDAGVAERVGRAASHVGGRLRLLSLPPAEQEALRRGDMTLREATDRAKLSTGYGGQRGMPHLSTTHALAAAAKARCVRLRHQRGKGQGVGGVACGACWESVIRADERQGLHAHSGRKGECAVCGGPYGSAPALGIAQ